ncbi:MAG: sensor histidine kinase, partial [Gemmatimonadaceae bacterium]
GVSCCEILIRRSENGSYVRAATAGDCVGAAELEPASLAEWVAQAGAPAAERVDRTTQLAPTSATASDGGESWPRSPGWVAEGDVRALLVPLQVRSRTVGVLRITHTSPIALDPAQRQFLDALAYYAALGVERVRLSAEAERAESFRQAGQLKDAVIAGVSHDLRTPLTTIKALAHGLAIRGESDAASIEAEADRLNRMVADLLDLSRLNANAMPLHVELNLADDIIGVALQRTQGPRGERIIHVTAVDGPSLGAQCDLVQAVRVLVNLLENALKYSPPAEPIDVMVQRRDDRLEFTVADRGPGIPTAERDRVFTPFYRPPNTPPDVGGAGLGLAIARRLAEAQQGTVRVESRDGGGSLLHFDLPFAELPTLDTAI